MPALLPLVQQSFDANLLSYPMPKMREGSHSLWDVYLYIKNELYPRAKSEIKRSKCLDLMEEFLELYERAKDKEKELEKEATHFTQRSFYFIKSIGQKDERIFTRLVYRTICYRISRRRKENCKI